MSADLSDSNFYHWTPALDRLTQIEVLRLNMIKKLYFSNAQKCLRVLKVQNRIVTFSSWKMSSKVKKMMFIVPD